MIDERAEIAGVVGRIGPAGNFARRRKSAVSEGHARVGAAEMRHLLPPAQMVAAEPVGEHDRRPGAGDLVIEAAPGPVEVAALGLKSARGGRHARHILAFYFR
jgi:hypothetical protein